MGQLSAGVCIARLPHSAPIVAGTFLPDGSRFVTGGTDGAARAWDVQTGREVSRLQGEAPLSGIAVSPVGSMPATGNDTDAARTWLLRPADLVVEACRRLTRNLTPAEWGEFLGSEPYAPTCAGLDRDR